MFRYDRVAPAARDRGRSEHGAAPKPKLAVWKFASCDGCQLSLLDCEDELLAVAGAVEIAYFPEATRAEVARAVRPVAGRGLDHHAARRRADPARSARSLEVAGHDRRLRHGRRHPGAAQLRATSTDFVARGLRHARLHRHAGDLDADRRPRAGRLRAARLPDQQAPAARGDQRLPRTAASRTSPATASASSASARGNVCVMVAHGTPCLGPVTHAGCGALCPAYDRGCYGCFGPMETPEHRVAGRAGWQRLGVERRATSCAPSAPSTPLPSRSARRASAMSDASRRSRSTTSPGSRARRAARHDHGDGVVQTSSSASSSRRASSRRSCAAAQFTEAPDITARICGICPVAYQMSAVHAMEDALGVTVDGQLRALRRLLYCGEWIESHVLHVYMLHAPDFLGYQSAIDDGAGPSGESSSAACALKKVGNAIDGAARRPRDPPDQRAGRRLLPRARRKRELAGAGRAARVGARRGAARRCAGSPGFDFPGLRARLRVRRAAPPRRISVQRGAASSPTAGSTSPSREYDDAFVEEHVAALERAALAAARRAAPTSSARWRATA